MKKSWVRKILCTTLAVILLMLPAAAFAAEEADLQQQLLQEQAGSSEIQRIEDQMKKYEGQDIKEIIPEYNPQKILSEAAKGKLDISPIGVLNGIVRFLFGELQQNIQLLIKLIVLVILCAVLKNLQASFLSHAVGELAFYACYVVIVSILILSFSTAMNMGREIINNMVAFMQASIPVLVTLLVSGGNVATGSAVQPILVMIVEVSATLMRDVLIPLIYFSSILSIVNNISDKVQVSKLADFLKKISGWALGLILTIFIAFVTIQGSLGAVIDGVTSKTAKFAIGTFIPVVGKYLADAADTVIGCTLVIKNAAGIASMIGIVAICLGPLMKILAIMLTYRMTCALIEPVAEKRITNSINEIAGSMTYLLGVVAAVAFMFLIAVTAIVGAGNISTMIR